MERYSYQAFSIFLLGCLIPEKYSNDLPSKTSVIILFTLKNHACPQPFSIRFFEENKFEKVNVVR